MWIALALLNATGMARAVDIGVSVEPGVAVPVSAPQSRVFEIGGAQSLKARIGLTSYLDVGPSVSFLLLPAVAPEAEPAIAWGLGAGLRIQRPRDRASFLGISPWLDADALYIRNADLNRPGFDAAVGLAAPCGETRSFWIGPFIRYLHVLQGERAGYEAADAKVLSMGVTFEVRSAIARKMERARAPASPAEARVVAGEARDAQRRDHPERGEPAWQVVQREKPGSSDTQELKEKLYFAWDQSRLRSASFAVLDQVVRALLENPDLRVQIAGHSDSTGADEHNRLLSEQRANVVLDYLAAHGISRDRLSSKGLSSSEPLDSNRTVGGRENNRRVEFEVQLVVGNRESPKP